MTAELWLVKPCEHGATEEHAIDDMAWALEWCPGGSRVRLDPDKVVFTTPNDMWGCDDEYTVQDVIDALEEAANG